MLSGTVAALEELLQESTPNERRENVPQSKDKRQKRTEQRVSALIQSCDLSRALNALAGSPPLEITEELMQKVRDLHPSAEEEHCIPQSAPTNINVAPNDRIYKENDLIRVIKDLRTHAAPDMTGLRPSHIKCIFRGRRKSGSPEARSRFLLDRLIRNNGNPIAAWNERILGKFRWREIVSYSSEQQTKTSGTEEHLIQDHDICFRPN